MLEYLLDSIREQLTISQVEIHVLHQVCLLELASEAIPHLFNQLNPPDANVPPAKISNTLIHNVTKPQTEISFIEGKGILTNLYNFSAENFRIQSRC